jgi:hypothetical protein
MLDVANGVKDGGTFEIQSKQRICLEDVGSEPEVVNHFGTKINWFKDFIESYYLKNVDFSNLMVTTNLMPADFGKRYGDRVGSRMSEMFNLVFVTGKDLRK